MKGFSVVCRNYGHWDFLRAGEARLFRIRGNPGAWKAMDERGRPYPVTEFKDFGTCVAFIMGELMHEDLVKDESSPGNNRPASVKEVTE